MPLNSFGTIFKVTTFGESHGPALGAVVDGVPAGIELTAERIQRDLDRRRPTARKEPDHVRILSGVFEDRTTGAPVALVVENQDARPEDYRDLKDVFRPGHADFTWEKKFGRRDWRGGGRSSGRETVARVAAGAVARLLLESAGIRVAATSLEIGGERDAALREALVSQAQKKGDSVGGLIEVRASGVPAGLGEPVFDKLDARLGAALLSIGAVKGVEIGDGFAMARMKGSEANDPMGPPDGFLSNHAGGILGGISTGQEIVVRAAVKPTPSIAAPQKTVNRKGQAAEISIGGRHDACLVPRVVVVAEAMVCLVLADALLLQRARQGFAQEKTTT
jgi:chorismate synthase